MPVSNEDSTEAIASVRAGPRVSVPCASRQAASVASGARRCTARPYGKPVSSPATSTTALWKTK